MLKVSQFYVKNQFVIHLPIGYVFQSYQSLIAFTPRRPNIDGSYAVLGPSWDYSKTTGKYRNLFLGTDSKTTLARIESGYYKVVPDLESYIEDAMAQENQYIYWPFRPDGHGGMMQCDRYTATVFSVYEGHPGNFHHVADYPSELEAANAALALYQPKKE